MEELISNLQRVTLGDEKDGVTLSVPEVISIWSEHAADVEVVTEVLRALRNSAGRIQCPETKARLFMTPEVIKLSRDILRTKRHVILLRLVLQFLFNASQGQGPEFHSEFWWNFGSEVLETFLKTDDSKVRNYSASVLYVQIRENPGDLNLNPDFLKTAILAALQQNSEFSLLALRALFKRRSKDFRLLVYEEVSDSEDRLAVLEIILASINEFPSELFAAIAEEFKSRSKNILTALSVEKSWSTTEALEVAKMMEILAAATSSDLILRMLQEDKSLLIDAVYLLKMVHEISKDEKNEYFKPVRKLSELNDVVSRENLLGKDDPIFGFKRDLIRIIGNLVWENKVNQDKVREMEGVQLILDCSSIDGKNPFITQWVVFAIRNLTFRNTENQNIILNLEKSGALDRKLLVEAGIFLT